MENTESFKGISSHSKHDHIENRYGWCHKKSRLFDLQELKCQHSLKWVEAGEISTHFGTLVACSVEKAILKVHKTSVLLGNDGLNLLCIGDHNILNTVNKWLMYLAWQRKIDWIPNESLSFLANKLVPVQQKCLQN